MEIIPKSYLSTFAMTRAKEYLYLSSAEYHYINGIRKRLRPSIFLCELKNDCG
ncbi:MAG: hypothetical protein IJP63_07985 [Acholeplasmatales bacterium]|nr:hypothetical protein [Acholeplasmatales bacterium]